MNAYLDGLTGMGQGNVHVKVYLVVSNEISHGVYWPIFGQGFFQPISPSHYICKI